MDRLTDRYALKVWIGRPIEAGFNFEPTLFSFSTYDYLLQVEKMTRFFDEINASFGQKAISYEVYLINRPTFVSEFKDYMITDDIADCIRTEEIVGAHGVKEVKVFNHFISYFNAVVPIEKREEHYQILEKFGIRNVDLLRESNEHLVINI